MWKKEIQVDPSSCGHLFITKNFAGFVCYDFTEEQARKVKIFDMRNGDLIASRKINVEDRGVNSLVAKGSFLCYNYRTAIHVIQVLEGSGVRLFEFCFPTAKFFRAVLDVNCNMSNYTNPCLMGFVSKTNVLVGNLRASSGRVRPAVLFSLDLDKVASARDKDEEWSAFSLPLLGEDCNITEEHHRSYQPVYRTDRINRCVDLVGVVKKVYYKGDEFLKMFTFVSNLQYIGETTCEEKEDQEAN